MDVLICGGPRQNVSNPVRQLKKGNSHKESKKHTGLTGPDWVGIYCIIRGGY